MSSSLIGSDARLTDASTGPGYSRLPIRISTGDGTTIQ